LFSFCEETYFNTVAISGMKAVASKLSTH